MGCETAISTGLGLSTGRLCWCGRSEAATTDVVFGGGGRASGPQAGQLSFPGFGGSALMPLRSSGGCYSPGAPAGGAPSLREPAGSIKKRTQPHNSRCSPAVACIGYTPTPSECGMRCTSHGMGRAALALLVALLAAADIQRARAGACENSERFPGGLCAAAHCTPRRRRRRPTHAHAPSPRPARAACNYLALPDPQEHSSSTTNTASGVRSIFQGIFQAMQAFKGVPEMIGKLGQGVMTGVIGAPAAPAARAQGSCRNRGRTECGRSQRRAQLPGEAAHLDPSGAAAPLCRPLVPPLAPCALQAGTPSPTLRTKLTS